MAKLKRLARPADEVASVECPLTLEEMDSRRIDYLLLTPKQFARKYVSTVFQPVRLTIGERDFGIQVNACVNQFCKWYGQSQHRFEEIKNKPSRYKRSGSDKGENKSITCNSDPTGSTFEMTWGCSSIA